MARYTKGGDVVRVPQINSELEKIETSIADLLSRKGDTPNEMLSTLDMNSNRITNLPAPVNGNDAARFADVVGGAFIVLTDEALVFDNVLEMTTADLVAGQYVRCKRYLSGGALVEDLVYEVQATATVDNFIDHANANGTFSILVGTNNRIKTSQFTSTPTSFQSAIVSVDARGIEIVIDSPVELTSATTINSDVTFKENGTLTTAQVNPDPNVAAYTFNGNVTAPRKEIFLGNGDIVLKGSKRVVYPEWFGIFNEENGNDGSVNLDSNIRRVGRCIGDSSCSIEFGNGLYFIRDFLLDQSNCGIVGQGKDQTFLKNSIVNNTSTRFGVQITAYGPNTSLIPQLGNRNWTGNQTIKDCYMRDFTVIWDDAATVDTDPQMNGIAILGVKGCELDNIHVSMPTGQRAFAIQSNDQDQETEDVIMRKCSSDGTISGVYISEGFVTNTNKSFKNIQVIDCSFSVRLIASGATLGPSSPIFFHGFEQPANIRAGKVLVKDCYGQGGAMGVYTQAPDTGKKFNSQVTVQGCSFENFREQGVLNYFEDMKILDNYFDSTVMQTVTVQAAGVSLYKNSIGGSLFSVVRGNTFKNLSGTGTIYGIQILANEGASHLLDANWFRYDNALTPAYDVFFLDSIGILTDVKLSNNKFYDTTVANVRGTTVNQEMLYHDLGGNQKMNLFNSEVYDTRLSTPVDSRYYVRGETLKYGLATFTAGTQVGYICTAVHTPLAVGTWKSVIG